MKVSINLFAGLEKYFESGKRMDNLIEVNEGIIIEELLEKLEIPGEEISIIMVNGKHTDKKYELKNGDEIYLFPLVMGG